MTKVNDIGFMDNYDEPIPEWSHLDSMALIEKVLFKQLGNDVLPEVRLILGVMKSAGDENDLDYFGSNAFTYHCMLLGLDDEEILETIVRKRLLSKKITTRHNYKTITEDEDKIRWLYEVEGVSQRVIAEMYNVSCPTIRKLLYGGYSPKIAFNGQQEEIIADYMCGVPTPQLLKLYNLSETSLYRALEGIPKTHKRGRPSSRTGAFLDVESIYDRNSP